VNRGGRWAGRGLITAGTIVTVVGLGIILIKTVHLPGYWMPFIVGVGLLLAGVIVWATSRDSSQ
jgi:hypothetical protein